MAVLPPTTPLQRAELTEYNDLVHIIRHGFIDTNVLIGGVPVALRSLLPWDRELLSRRIQNGSERQYKIWLLASVTWMLDGHVILDHPSAAALLYRTYAQLSYAHLNKLFGAYRQVSLRRDKATLGIESFTYENISRSLWIESRYSGIHNPAFKGHAADLGLSEIQRSWIVFNDYEDRKDRHELEWQTAKLIASASAPKGVEKLNSQDLNRKKEEESHRQGVMDRFYYTCKGLILGDAKDPELPKIGGSSADDLEEEMRRWILGEKDEHDTIVDNYKKHISDHFAQQLQDQEKHLKEAQKVSKDANENESAVALMGLTLSELRDRLQKEGYDPHTSTTHYQSKGREYLYRRYLEKAPSTGTLSVSEEGRIVSNAPPEEQVAPQEIDLSGRKVEFGEGIE
jgi:hypothetical protein